MSVKAKVEAIIYATEEPVTLTQLASLLREPVLAELRAEEDARLALNETVSDDTISDSHEESEAPEPVAQAGDPLTTTPAGIEATSGESDKEQSRRIKAHLQGILEELTAEYSASSHGVEVRQVAGGYRMGTKPEHHDDVVGFAKSLKPPVRLSLQALETLAVIAYKQPITVPEISEIRGVDSSGVIATLLDRKLITTSGRKQVIGRPILYKTTKEFLLRFGLNNVSELPSMEEFEKLGDPQTEMFPANGENPDAGAEPSTVVTDGEPPAATGTEEQIGASVDESVSTPQTPEGQS